MKILYLHDKEDWAIHNVGKLWLNNIPNTDVIFQNWKELDQVDTAQEYDYVWFGCFLIFLELRSVFDLTKSILAVHDPCELYPMIPDWKKQSTRGLRSDEKVQKRLNILRKATYVITISQEMHSLLHAEGVESHCIPTMSALPQRHQNFETTKCDVLSVFGDYPRKNIPLLQSIRDTATRKWNLEFYFKKGKELMLSDQEYRDLLDAHEVYICTSMQEGGPLPAMDAMRRGAVVITTPVGQMPEIIDHGINGYLCETQRDFLKVLKHLSHNLDVLHRMREASWINIQQRRPRELIDKSVQDFLYYLKQG